MNQPNFYRRMGAVIFFGIALGLLLTRCVSIPAKLLGIEKTAVSHASYGLVSFSEMSDQAAAIFVGKVTRLSPSQWNQDSGEYWDDDEENPLNMTTLLIHYVEVEVLQTIVTSITLESQIKLPVLSENVIIDEKNNVLNEKHPHGLAEGDQAVFFIRPTELAWRGGARPVLYLMGHPRQSYFKLGEDGLYHGELLEGAFTLEELIRRIEEERATPPQ